MDLASQIAGQPQDSARAGEAANRPTELDSDAADSAAGEAVVMVPSRATSSVYTRIEILYINIVMCLSGMATRESRLHTYINNMVVT